MGRRRPALHGLGDLPRQRVAGGSGSAVRVADEPPGSGRSSSAPTTGGDVGGGRQRVRLRRDPGTHQWYDGTQHPWEFARLALRAFADRPGHRLRRRRGRRVVPLDRRRPLVAGALGAARSQDRRAVAAGRGWAVPAHDPDPPRRRQRMVVAISAAGAFRTDDGGETWQPINRGLRSQELPDEDGRSGTASTGSRCTRRVPTSCSCRSTGT